MCGNYIKQHSYCWNSHKLSSKFHNKLPSFSSNDYWRLVPYLVALCFCVTSRDQLAVMQTSEKKHSPVVFFKHGKL